MKIFRFFFYSLPLIFKGKDKVSKALSKRKNFLENLWGNPKWDGIFSFSLLPIVVTDAAFRKSSLGELS